MAIEALVQGTLVDEHSLQGTWLREKLSLCVKGRRNCFLQVHQPFPDSLLPGKAQMRLQSHMPLGWAPDAEAEALGTDAVHTCPPHCTSSVLPDIWCRVGPQ